MTRAPRIATRLVRGGRLAEDPYGSTAVPLYQTASFVQPDARGGGAFDYTRSGNPTRAVLERQLADLEGGGHGFAFASGMAALTTLVRSSPGRRIVAGADLYGGAWRFLQQVAAVEGCDVSFVDARDPARVDAALAERPGLVLLESPTNPCMEVLDLRALAGVCAARDSLLAVDSSMMPPVLQRPLELGAHVVVHSATKFLGGHGDLTAGVVVTGEAGLAERIAFRQNAEGNALAPFECWLLLRGLKTLHLRVRAQQDNARAVAALLAEHPAVMRLRWPGSGVGGQAELHASQANGPGAVVCFETGDEAQSLRIVDALQLFSAAVSFGGVASQASLPCRMSHASIPAGERAARALPEDLIRLAVGIEDPEDLVTDLEQALAIARVATLPA